MLSSALNALTDRFDLQFLTAYGLPAVIVGLSSGTFLGPRIGWDQLAVWIEELDAVEGSLAALLVLLVLVMLALVFRALTLPIAALYAGVAWPRGIAAWAVKQQVRTRHKTAAAVSGAPNQVVSAQAARANALIFDVLYPRDEAETKPTRLGNILAAAEAYPRDIYGMDGAVWWPRLMPLLPSEFAKTLGDAQGPLLALLNLSVVFIVLAPVGAIVLAVGGLWLFALLVLLGGVLLARMCYLAAVTQAAEIGSLIRIGCDLYRFEILTQLDLPKPADLAAERTLWRDLTAQILSPAGSTRAAAEKAETTIDHRRP